MIVELQHEQYNIGALKNDISLPLLIETMLNFKCTDPLFTNNGPDGDYGFINHSFINAEDTNNLPANTRTSSSESLSA